MQDREPAAMTISCCECHEEFVFTIGEQKFYAEKGFTPPKRCPKCRTARKIRREEDRDR